MSFGDWISSTFLVVFCCNKLFNRNQTKITLTPQDYISNQISITFSQFEFCNNRYFDEIQRDRIIYFFNIALGNATSSIPETIKNINSIISVIEEASENKNENDDRKKKYDEYIVMLSDLVKEAEEAEKILASKKTISYIELDNKDTHDHYDGDNNQTTIL